MAYSSIERKKCKCGCQNFPTISYEGYYHQHAPQEVLDRLDKKQKRKSAAKNAQSKLKALSYESEDNREMVAAYKSKSELLKEADRVYANFIKSRDTDKDGNVFCPCCNKSFNAENTQMGQKIINCMHFIDRNVYSLRFDEDYSHAGHSWCNKKQHDSPKGFEYQNFKKYLVSKFGQDAVDEAELAHRKINKITEQQLKTIIEHYSTN